jgi:hypothetical protein
MFQQTQPSLKLSSARRPPHLGRNSVSTNTRSPSRPPPARFRNDRTQEALIDDDDPLSISKRAVIFYVRCRMTAFRRSMAPAISPRCANPWHTVPVSSTFGTALRAISKNPEGCPASRSADPAAGAAFEQVINLKTSKAVDLTIPQSILQRVNEVRSERSRPVSSAAAAAAFALWPIGSGLSGVMATRMRNHECLDHYLRCTVRQCVNKSGW